MRPPASIPLPDGLIWRGDAPHIDTSLSGRRIRRSCGTSSVPEARRLLDTLCGQRRMTELIGIAAPVGQRRVDLRDFLQDA